MATMTKEFYNLVLTTKLPHLKFCLVFGEKNATGSSPYYTHECTFDNLDELPESFHNAIRLLDAAADTDGSANLTNVGARRVRNGLATPDNIDLPGTYYYILDPEFDRGACTYNIQIT